LIDRIVKAGLDFNVFEQKVSADLSLHQVVNLHESKSEQNFPKIKLSMVLPLRI